MARREQWRRFLWETCCLRPVRPLHLLQQIQPDPPPPGLHDVRQTVAAAPLAHRHHADPEQLGDLGRGQPDVLDVGRIHAALSWAPACCPVTFPLLA